MAKATKKGSTKQGSDLLENPEVLAEKLTKTEQFIEQNKKLVFGIGGAIAAVIVGYFLYNYYVTNQNEEAQSEMYQAVYYFEADSVDRALNGDGNNLGFIDILEDYSWTDAANLANYYAGACYLKKGEYISAVEHLSNFSASDLVIQSRAYALIGDANMEMGQYEEAASQYKKAAAHHPNQYTSPNYLIKAAIAYEQIQDYKSAYNCYAQITNEFYDSSEYQEARKHKARLEGRISG